MATVRFSVPDEVKAAFDAAFAGENKSALIARLMWQAVEERRHATRRALAIDALLGIRGRAPAVSARAVQRARRAIRR